MVVYSHEIVLLVGCKQYLAVVYEVADHGGAKEGVEGKIDDGQPQVCMGKYQGEEEADDECTCEDNGSNSIVQISQDRENLLYLLPVVTLQRLKQEISYAG